MEGTIWAFMPALIAIILALVTKQVYVSLFLGIFVGAMMYVGGNPVAAMQTLYELMSAKVIDVSVNTITLEMADTVDNIDTMTNLLKPYGIKEIVRTGTVAIEKGSISAK